MLEKLVHSLIATFLANYFDVDLNLLQKQDHLVLTDVRVNTALLSRISRLLRIRLVDGLPAFCCSACTKLIFDFSFLGVIGSLDVRIPFSAQEPIVFRVSRLSLIATTGLLPLDSASGVAPLPKPQPASSGTSWMTWLLGSTVADLQNELLPTILANLEIVVTDAHIACLYTSDPLSPSSSSSRSGFAFGLYASRIALRSSSAIASEAFMLKELNIAGVSAYVRPFQFTGTESDMVASFTHQMKTCSNPKSFWLVDLSLAVTARLSVAGILFAFGAKSQLGASDPALRSSKPTSSGVDNPISVPQLPFCTATVTIPSVCLDLSFAQYALF